MEKINRDKYSFFNRENLFKYSRIIGGASYAGLGIAVSQPGLMRSNRGDLTNVFLTGSVVGGALYLYERRHLQEQKTKKKVLISVYGSGLFNLGSLLIWAIFKAATQEYNLHPVFRGFVSLAASYYMLRTALDWFQIIDKE